MTVDMRPMRERERDDSVPEMSGVILLIAIVAVLMLLALVTV